MAARNRRRSGPSADSDLKRQKTEASKDIHEFGLQAIGGLNKLYDGKYQIITDFLALPSKKLYPDYYVEIKKPISLNEIKNKINTKAYSSLAEILSDFKLMSDNACQFNDEQSDIARNSKKIYEFMKSQVDKHNAGHKAVAPAPLPKLKIKLNKPKQETPQPPVEEEKSDSKAELKRDLLSIVEYLIEYKDNGVNIAEPFLVEVPRKEFPDYYKLIKKAMALNTVKKNVNSNKYSDLDDFKAHLDLIWSNAQLYNQEDSLIYQDAETLKRAADVKIQELKQGQEVQAELEVEEAEPEQESEDEDQDRDEDQEEKDLDEVKDEDEEEDEEEMEDEEEAAEIEDEEAETQDMATPFSTTSEPTTYLSTIKKSIPSKSGNRIKALDSFIQEVTISSSRAIYRQTIRASSTTMGVPPPFQNWFEYRIQAVEDFDKNKPKSFSINLPSHSSGSISVSVGLNDSLIKKKHSSSLSINGERVNPQPSIHYADAKRELTSRYELKIPIGLNKIKLDVSTVNFDETSSTALDLRPYNASEQETILFWVQVS